MDSDQSPSANGPGQFPEPPINRERDKDEHPRSPDHGKDQGREVPGFNHEGYKEADVKPSVGDEETESGPDDEDGLPEDTKKRVPS